MKEISLFDDNHISNDQTAYHLVVSASQYDISYAILDLFDKQFVGIKHHHIDKSKGEKDIDYIIQFFDKEPILQHAFKNVSICFESMRAMLVPDNLFNDQNLESFLMFHHDIDEKDHIHSNHIKPAEAFVVFTFPSLLEDALNKKYPGAKVFHQSTPFLTRIFEQRIINDNSTKLYINFSTDFFDILLIKQNKIILHNCFFYKKYTDVLYFLVNLLNLFSLSPGTIELTLSGDIVAGSEADTEIQWLFNHIRFETFTTQFKYASSFAKLPAHQFSNLIHLAICE